MTIDTDDHGKTNDEGRGVLEEPEPTEYTALQHAIVGIWQGVGLVLSLGILAGVVIFVLAGLRALTKILLVG